ncbi:MAG TPA: FAD-binding oxidoreductase [Firmicutes bacterium]|nr:FAD-binding oxidoreductase [Candidatus Fermentithermobacillaceae bacterium]
MMSKVCDVIVVGCGVIGAAITYYLSASGMEVVAVEENDVGSGTSSRCDGNVLVIDKKPGFDCELALKSQELFETLEDDISFDVEYRQLGSVLAVETEAQAEGAAQWHSAMSRSGVRVKYIESSDVHAHEPMLAQDIVGLFECASDSSLNPMNLVYGYVLAAQNNGAVIKTRTKAKRLLLDTQHHIKGVETSEGTILAPLVVISAGVWTPQIVRTCGVDVPIVPRKGHIIVSERTFKVASRKIQEFGYIMAKFGEEGQRDVEPEMEKYGIAMVFEPTPHENFLIGSSREFAGFDTTCNMEVVSLMAKRAIRFFPCIEDVRVIRTYAGLRPYTQDHRPIISKVDQVPGLYIASGHEGDGIGLAPITGLLVSEMLLGCTPSVPLEPLSLNRFM